MIIKIVLILMVLFFMYVIIASVLFIKIALLRRKKTAPIFMASGPRAPYAQKMKKSADWFIAQNPQTVSITSFDGLKLVAYYLSAKNKEKNKGTILLMHGYHSSGLRDFACIFEYFYNEGFSILLPDQRAHNRSEGKNLTFGVRERFDCCDWIRWINNYEQTKTERAEVLSPIWLMGISMGAATVMFASGFDLPGNVKGIIADCGFTSPREIIKLSLNRDYHMLAIPVLAVANILTKIFCGFGLNEYSTKKAFETNTNPVLFVHGTNDNYVPHKMSVENYHLCKGPKEFLTTKAAHAISFVSASDLYKDNLEKFINKYQ